LLQPQLSQDLFCVGEDSDEKWHTREMQP
jgi:hypothetical protein